MRLLYLLSRGQDGATAVEYGLVAAIIAVALIAGFGGFSETLLQVFETIEGYLAEAMA